MIAYILYAMFTTRANPRVKHLHKTNDAQKDAQTHEFVIIHKTIDAETHEFMTIVKIQVTRKLKLTLNK